MNVPAPSTAQNRLLQIARARHAVMQEGGSMTDVLVNGWFVYLMPRWKMALDAEHAQPSS